LKNKQDGVLDKDKMMDNVQKHNICTNTIYYAMYKAQLFLSQTGNDDEM
jgi:hypothetical protein